MLNSTKSRTLLRFLSDEFSRVGKKTARQIIVHAGKQLSDRSFPRHIAHAQATALHKALQETRIAAPPTDCIVPIGEQQLLQGLRKELEADFYTVVTRPAAAYRGNPFQVEIAVAYGAADAAAIEVDESGHMQKSEAHSRSAIARKDEPVRLLRFANRVPLRAVGLCDYQGRDADQLARIWSAAAEGCSAGGADDRPGACRLCLGAIYLGVQGGDRAVS
jgi:DNA topoisomerase-6 subunit B